LNRQKDERSPASLAAHFSSTQFLHLALPFLNTLPIQLRESTGERAVKMGIISLTYMRPSYVTNDTARRRSRESFLSEGESVRSGKSARSSGIPDAVSFEKIINGVTCPVCGVLSSNHCIVQ